MRKIPAVMATQHPDNAFAPFWAASGEAFVNAMAESKECIECFRELGVDEYMWDWEGKHADAAVVDKLLSEHNDFFTKNQIGRDIYLTFRIPNIWNEKGYSLIQAMTAILIAEDFGRDLHLKQRPLFEVILPMTERADQLMKMHKLFEELAKFKSKAFNGGEANTEYLEMIPLVESVDNQLAIGNLLMDYLDRHKKHFKNQPAYIRPFLARSDPAMESGMLATVIANKIALSQIAEFSARTGVAVFPIAGPGSLPFRGGLSPERASTYAHDNPGLRTLTVQSSFRYDFPKSQVKRAIKKLEADLPKTKFRCLAETEIRELVNVAKGSEAHYQKTLKMIIADMAGLFKSVPRRRERRLHIGLLAYQRSLGQQSLPRAITFTCGFYSLGVPPEFIGLGRALAGLTEQQLAMVLHNYPTLINDIELAGRYLNRENLSRLIKQNKAWRDVENDIELATSILGLKFGPHRYNEHAHKNLSSNVLLAKNNQVILPGLINELAQLRRSLG